MNILEQYCISKPTWFVPIFLIGILFLSCLLYISAKSCVKSSHEEFSKRRLSKNWYDDVPKEWEDYWWLILLMYTILPLFVLIESNLQSISQSWLIFLPSAIIFTLGIFFPRLFLGITYKIFNIKYGHIGFWTKSWMVLLILTLLFGVALPCGILMIR